MIFCSFKVYQQVRKSYRASVHPTTIIRVRSFGVLNPKKLVQESSRPTISNLRLTIETNVPNTLNESTIDSNVPRANVSTDFKPNEENLKSTE